MRIGIDFGTTHTSAAYYDGAKSTFVPLDPQNADENILRSMIYVNREQELSLGLKAVETFLLEDTGRPVVYEEKVVGTLTNTVASVGRGPLQPDGPITIVYDTVIDEDVGARGRLLQSIKTGLQSPSYLGTNIFGREYSIQELIALILSHVRSSAERTFGTEVDAAVLGRPVKFSDDADADKLAQDRLEEAAKLAGFRHVAFEREPIAAALFYLNSLSTPEKILVFDFGGGTLDLTIVDGHGAQEYDILATKGVLIGGDDLDSAMMRDSIAPHFGAGLKIDASYDGRHMYLDERTVGLLDRWQTVPMLSRPDPLKLIERAIIYGENPQAFKSLKCLVTQNYGFPLFEQIEAAKRRLSDELEARVEMKAAEIDLSETVSRRQFNQSMGDEIADIRTSVRQVVAQADLAPPEIDVVVTTGGSSAIPAFQKMLQREFSNARVVQSDVFGSVTSGLAIRASEQG